MRSGRCCPLSGTGEVSSGHQSYLAPSTRQPCALVQALRDHGGDGSWNWDRRGEAEGHVPSGKEAVKGLVATCECPMVGTELGSSWQRGKRHRLQ